ncbi:ABC transporter permease [Pseudalkalibacillus caeni]|uniref:ABC transporter permease n=1 Tax=Exobacillus caeni TaxID=2574798 RepID=A0A5R9F9B7_9BACL|nr:ABC transporter permease [Pseudalkalibacillus caeni]TLS38238.1 ABC transporter permease [Pseudalkalibacillus caeni]
MRSLFINPVLNKEFKLRLRSVKSFLGILFYLLVLGAIALGFLYITSVANQSGYFRPEESRGMFIVLSMVQLGLILFMTPGLTAGVISGERERQTLNMLLTTQQSSTSIVISKLVSSLSFLLLMIVSSLPIYSIVFLFGGVSPSALASTFGIYLLTMLGIGSIGVMCSTIFRKTIVAMITTYGIALFLTAGTGFLMIFILNAFMVGNPNQATNPLPYFTVMTNPAVVLFTVFEPNAKGELLQRAGIEFPLWLSFSISYLLIAFTAIAVSVKKLRPNMRAGKSSKGNPSS